MTKITTLPLVSVIVPVYNVEKYLDGCISSIIEQTYREIEVIVVDDGSPDACPKRCDEWARVDDRIKVIHQPNGGLSAARNTGLEAVKGEYVIFVDSDDALVETAVEKLVSFALDNASDVVLFKHLLLSEDGKNLTEYSDNARFPDTGVDDARGALHNLVTERIHNYAQLRLVSTRLYKELDFAFPNGMLMEDLLSTYLVLGASKSVGYLNEPLYLYRQNVDGSITFNWNQRLTEASHCAFLEMEKYISINYQDLYVETVNWAVKFLIWCWLREKQAAGRKSGWDKRSKEIKGFVGIHVNQIDPDNLDTLNRVKYGLLKAGVLGCTARFMRR